MHKIFGLFLLSLTLLAGCSDGGGGGGGVGGGGNIGPPGTNANLSDLILSAGPLDQVFQANQTVYTATVGFLATSTTVTPTTQDGNATVTVNGAAVVSGTASVSITLNVGLGTITVIVTAEDGIATKTYTIDVTRQLAATFGQQAFLKASNAEEKDRFGFSVALSGDTLVVGAVGESSDDNSKPDAGAVYVFTRDINGVWSQQDVLRAANADAGDLFGGSVALSGDTLVVGAVGDGSDDNSKPDAGAVYVFAPNINGVWSQQDVLRAANSDAGDLFGGSVALLGDTLAVGAVGDGGAGNNKPDAGAAYAFTRDNAGVWSQQPVLRAANSDAGDLFGGSVAPSGDTLAVGAAGEGGAGNGKPDAGAVYLFTRDNAGLWIQQPVLRAANTDAGDLFGGSVTLSGDTLVVGAAGEGGAGNSKLDAGAVYMFTRDNVGLWSQQPVLRAATTDAGDLFGGAVALSGDTLAVGAIGEGSSAGGGVDDNSAPGAGATYIYK